MNMSVAVAFSDDASDFADDERAEDEDEDEDEDAEVRV